MRTGELAAKAGVNIQTIRFYERERLLRQPPRSAGGYRRYSEQDLELILFIRECQSLGFTLADIRELVELHGIWGAPQRVRQGDRMMKIIEARLASIEEKLGALTRMRAGLQNALATAAVRNAPTCPAQLNKREGNQKST